MSFERLSHIALLGAVLSVGLGSQARADGTFSQIDIGKQTVTAVGAVERGALSFGLVRSDHEGGHEWSLSTSYRVARPRIFGADGTVRAGVVAKVDDAEDLGAGLRLTVESYRALDWGSVFWLAQADTLDGAYYAGVQVGLGQGPIGIGLEAQGGDDWRERSAVVTWRLSGTPVSLRLGRKFETEEVFVGVSVNTF